MPDNPDYSTYLKGDAYPDLCFDCQRMVNLSVYLVAKGPRRDDREAPYKFIADHALFCVGLECEREKAAKAQAGAGNEQPVGSPVSG